MDKKELRRYIKETVSGISPETRSSLSLGASWPIMQRKEWIEAKSILLFSSLPDEIDMKYLVDAALSQGKTVILPVVNGEILNLYIYDPEKIQSGSFGIMEPTCECISASPQEVDLAIIPGRAFTKEGKRLGRGKGFYDRLLPLMNCPKWGICYPCQIVEDIAVDPWDILLDDVFFA